MPNGMPSNIETMAKSAGNAISNFGNYSAQAAARANAVSAAAQKAQGDYNKTAADNANAIGSDRIADQYQFNSGQAASANDFTSGMWGQAAGWNEEMFNRAMEFNAAEAQKNREWQEHMSKTAYQRAVKDMKAAGLNPILAVTGGGISTGAGGGSAASISQPEMSGASGAMASGGLMNGITSSVGNYTGQMEYMGGLLGLLSAGISGLSSAFKNFGSLGDLGESFGNALMEGLQTSDDKYGKWSELIRRAAFAGTDPKDIWEGYQRYKYKWSDSLHGKW